MSSNSKSQPNKDEKTVQFKIGVELSLTAKVSNPFHRDKNHSKRSRPKKKSGSHAKSSDTKHEKEHVKSSRSSHSKDHQESKKKSESRTLSKKDQRSNSGSHRSNTQQSLPRYMTNQTTPNLGRSRFPSPVSFPNLGTASEHGSTVRQAFRQGSSTGPGSSFDIIPINVNTSSHSSDTKVSYPVKRTTRTSDINKASSAKSTSSKSKSSKPK